jgi:hypothetical protein
MDALHIFPVGPGDNVHIPIARNLYQYISGIEVPVREDNVVVVLKSIPSLSIDS